MNNKIGLRFGAMADPLEDQLRDQGFTATRKQLKVWDKLAFSITMLRIHCLIPDSQADKAYDKLMKKVSKGVEALEVL